MGDQRHAEDFFGYGAGIGGIFGDFDSAAFASPTGVDLGFDDDAAA
jgi:hypothetical protein